MAMKKINQFDSKSFNTIKIDNESLSNHIKLFDIEVQIKAQVESFNAKIKALDSI
jgi:hypothetical protein